MKKLFLSICLLFTLIATAQVGGTRSFRFLELPMTARAAALGGNNMAIWGDDINLLYSNPALLNPGMVKQVAFNYCNFVSDINFFNAAYAHSLKEKGMVAGSLQAFSYGQFNGYDELGTSTGKFKAADYSMNLNYSKPLGDSMFNVGVCLKTLLSQYDIYSSVGNALDFGVTYHNKKNFVVSLQARNIGYVWKSYSSANFNNDALANTVQLGFSYKPANAPFKFFMVYDQLLRWNMRYVSPVDTTGKSSTLGLSSSQKDSTSWQKFKMRAGTQADNFMKHITVGSEIQLGKNFALRVAYNYRRQREMTLPDKRGAAGLSFGFGLKIKRFSFSYSFSKMAVPGNSSIMGLTFIW